MVPDTHQLITETATMALRIAWCQNEFHRPDTEESKFASQTTRHWKRHYEAFGQALVAKAKSAGLDSTSLSKVLARILADTEGQYLAYLPIAAYVTRLNTEPVWIVVIHWEQSFGPEDPIPVRPLSHVRTYAFTQTDLRQVAFLTCR